MRLTVINITLSEEDSQHAERLRQLRATLFGTDQESFRYRGTLSGKQRKLITIWKRRAFALVEVAA